MLRIEARIARSAILAAVSFFNVVACKPYEPPKFELRRVEDLALNPCAQAGNYTLIGYPEFLGVESTTLLVPTMDYQGNLSMTTKTSSHSINRIHSAPNRLSPGVRVLDYSRQIDRLYGNSPAVDQLLTKPVRTQIYIQAGQKNNGEPDCSITLTSIYNSPES